MSGESTSAESILLKMITLPNTPNGRSASILSPHPTRSAQSMLAARHTATYFTMLRGERLTGLSPAALILQALYGISPHPNFAKKQKLSPTPTPPNTTPTPPP